MGKGKRSKDEREEKRNKIMLSLLSREGQEILSEIRLASARQLVDNELAIPLFILDKFYGFSEEELTRFIRIYDPVGEKLKHYYETRGDYYNDMDVPWLAEEYLKNKYRKTMKQFREEALKLPLPDIDLDK